MNEPQDLPDIVTSREAADLLMVDQRTIQRLAQGGYIQRTGLGRYVTTSVVQGYIRWLKEERKSDSRVSAENRVRIARAESFEQSTSAKARDLMLVDELDELLDEVMGVARKEMVGFASKVTDDPEIQLRIDGAVDAIFAQTKAKKMRRIRALRATGRSAAPRSYVD